MRPCFFPPNVFFLYDWTELNDSLSYVTNDPSFPVPSCIFSLYITTLIWLSDIVTVNVIRRFILTHLLDKTTNFSSRFIARYLQRLSTKRIKKNQFVSWKQNRGLVDPSIQNRYGQSHGRMENLYAVVHTSDLGTLMTIRISNHRR